MTNGSAAAQARAVLARLKKTYPDARCALTHRGPFQLLMATILSAQCTDERVNKVTPTLFKRYPRPADLAAAEPAEVERIIHSTGFYRQKAKSLIGMAQGIQERFGGKVPQRLEELITLPGVWRKTANVILGNCFETPGVVVDTHVGRLSRRLGWSRSEDPDQIEQELMKLLPRTDWTLASHLLIFHGRRICQARKPDCPACPVNLLCPKRGVPKTISRKQRTSPR
ncbi:MAG: endonuclease III [Candidatus Omnitrophica bacterium CG11_big_fil_rev_8_21_14_0_20_64_10]|nr:MAG: endonuclease III [Candidatus Omnitrophica bacterium CG11_big_fil_rev_8_21_14_0_20_64_10]